MTKGAYTMSEAEYQIESLIDKQSRFFGGISSNKSVDCRSILHLFSTNELKRVAKVLYDEGRRGEPNYEKMVVDVMNNPYELSEKQRNAIITFIMYAL